MKSELAYRLIFPNGWDVRLYSDGHTEGLPEGVQVTNRVPLIKIALREHLKSEYQEKDNRLPQTLEA